MGSAEDLNGELAKCKQQQKQFAQKIRLQQGDSSANKSFLALYEHTFGKIPGTFYMDHVMDQFEMATDMVATQPTSDMVAATSDTNGQARKCCCILGAKIPLVPSSKGICHKHQWQE